MITNQVRVFLENNHRGVLSTFRRSGAAQMSIVTVGMYRGDAAFTTTEHRAKLVNLRREPRCSLLVSKEDWWGFLVLEGHATVFSSDRTDADELAQVLRDVYVAASGVHHPDWEEYDQAMREDGRVAVVLSPDRIYGTALNNK